MSKIAAKDSEFRAYPLIEKALKEHGWNTTNPARSHNGQVYNQREFQRHETTLSEGLGQQAPESVVLVQGGDKPIYWVIEAKAEIKQIEDASQEAQGYAKEINEASRSLCARFATGWAGTQENISETETWFLNGAGTWERVTINGYPITGLLDQEEMISIVKENNPALGSSHSNLDRFLYHAEAINKAWHRYGIPVNDRARTLAAILLSMAGDSQPRLHSSAQLLVKEINSLLEAVLEEHGKGEFLTTLALQVPPAKQNHQQYREALVQGISILRKMNIRSALNSETDTLGEFYETFLRYANGAKEMGIVLTPRHMTRLAAEVCGVTARDRVYDPAAGTGGFLIACLDRARRHTKKDQGPVFQQWLEEGIWGVEQDANVYALALVNMIFRGDGKSGISNRSCFDRRFWKTGKSIIERDITDSRPVGSQAPFTKSFLNPPFGREGMPETDFIDNALSQTRRGGLVFCILPVKPVQGLRAAAWRAQTLRKHTLIASVRLSPELFYPVNVQTYVVVLRAHEPHPDEAQVAFARLFDDDHRPRPSKLLSKQRSMDNYKEITLRLKNAIAGNPCLEPSNEEWTVCALGDENEQGKYGWGPEHYLVGPYLRRQIEAACGGKRRQVSAQYAKALVEDRQSGQLLPDVPSGRTIFRITDICDVYYGDCEALKRMSEGDTPVISNTEKKNGIAGFFDVAEEYQNAITVSVINNSYPCEAFFHPYGFNAVKDLLILIPKDPEMRECDKACMHLCEQITMMNKWKYHYERTVIVDELVVNLPIRDDGQPDVEIMAGYIT